MAEPLSDTGPKTPSSTVFSRWPLRFKLLVALVMVTLLVLVPMGAVLYWRVERFASQDLPRQVNAQVGVLLREFGGPDRRGMRGGPPDGMMRPDRVRDQSSSQDRRPPDTSGRRPVPPWCTALHGQPDPPPRFKPLDPQVIAALCDPKRDLEVESTAQAFSVAASQQTISNLLGTLRVTYAVGGVILLMAAAGLGVGLLNQGLGPLRRIAARAQHLSADSLSERLEVPAANDEVQQLAVSLNRMLDRLQHSFEALRLEESRTRAFAAAASHELRTPVAALRGSLDVLSRAPEDDHATRTRLMRTLRREAERIARLVDDLLTLTRLDAGESLRLEPLELQKLLEHLIERATDLAPEHRFHLDAPDLQISADANRLEQAIWNLISNAVRYGAPQSTITVFARNTTLGLELGVFNSGDTIPDGVQTRMFERFYRADEARDASGVGLGLSIVAAIAQAHGGQTFVRSPVHHGAVSGNEIGFTLPNAPTNSVQPTHNQPA
jgi:two-component system OmpR family sensor kinase